MKKHQKKKYVVCGYDAYGQPAAETIEFVPPTWKQKIRQLVIRIIGIDLAYRFGLTKMRKITSISVKK